MPSGRDALRVLLPLALHAAAREVDRALGLLLHTSLDLDDFVRQAFRLIDPSDLALHVAAWCAVGMAAWLVLARAIDGHATTSDARPRASDAFLPLLLRPAITVLALLALAVQPVYPYGSRCPSR